VSDTAPKKRAKPEPDLTLREVRFAEHFASHGCASDAYRAAGYPERGAESTCTLAARVLRRPKVRKLIRDLRAEALAKAQVTVDYLVAGFKRAVDLDIAELYRDDGTLLPVGEWPERVRLAVKKLKRKPVMGTAPDPDDPTKRVQVVVGEELDVVFEDKTECRKVLAQFTRMIGPDADAGKAAPAPLVIGGEADPSAL
jgi:phage terminase small subunit